MSSFIKLTDNELQFVIAISDDNKASLVHFAAEPFNESDYNPDLYMPTLELHLIGQDIASHHGTKHVKMCPSMNKHYVSHTIEQNDNGNLLKLNLSDDKIFVTQNYQFYKGTDTVRCFAEIENRADDEAIIAYVTSFAYYGLSKYCENFDTDSSIYVPHNTWCGELQWRKNTVREHGLTKINASGLKRISFNQCGSWSSQEYLPMGVFENDLNNHCLYWQIEHNGSWYAEYSELSNNMYIGLCGPDSDSAHFEKRLKKGEKFVTVPVAAGVTTKDFTGAIANLTDYRRAIRRKNADNEELPVIFNDYMNCLWAEPTTEKCLPLIEAAAKAGCEYYVMDAGWYTDQGSWWETIGQWEEAKSRFPNGLIEVMDKVREAGLKPGLWIEIEGMGMECPLAKELPDDWFFCRNGKRVIDHERFHLDFRNKDVVKHVDTVMDGIVSKYGIKYFKIDYNITSGIGTDVNSDSLGEGLLEHNRAYLKWLDAFLARHPDIVIENCASGAMRMDYAMLSRLSIQSTSDQSNYKIYSSISCMAPTAVTPEQSAVWSYPDYKTDSEEEAVSNMVNVMLGRIHQSGLLNQLPEKMFNRVKEGIECYKSIRQDIKSFHAVFPLGIISFSSPWAAGGLIGDNTLYLAVWRKDSDKETLDIPLECIGANTPKTAECIYPVGLPVEFKYNESNNTFAVTLPANDTARLFKLTF